MKRIGIVVSLLLCSPVLAQRKTAGFGRKASLSSLTGLTRG